MSEYTHFQRFDPEFDDVYASIALAFRNSAVRRVPGQKNRVTKAQVAAVHQKMQSGEPLGDGWEQEVAGRLRQQAGATAIAGPQDQK